MFFVDTSLPKHYAKIYIKDQISNSGVLYQYKEDDPVQVMRRRRKYVSFYQNTKSELLIPERLA